MSTIFQKTELSEPALFSPSDTTKKLTDFRKYVSLRFLKIAFKSLGPGAVLKKMFWRTVVIRM